MHIMIQLLNETHLNLIPFMSPHGAIHSFLFPMIPFSSSFILLSPSLRVVLCTEAERKTYFSLYVTPLKSSTVGDGSWLTVTEPGPQGTSTALWRPDALPGRGNATSTAAAGGF